MVRQNASLLPLLTLSKPEARSFLGALDQVLVENHQSPSKNWGIVRDIARTTLLCRSAGPERATQAPRRRRPRI